MSQDLMPISKNLAPGGSFPYLAPQEEPQGSQSMEQIFFVIFKWKRLILSLFLTFAVAGGIAMYLKPPVRTASAKILLKKDRATLKISGTAIRGIEYPVQYMLSEIELMKSRAVLLSAAKEVLMSQGRSEQEITHADMESVAGMLDNRLRAIASPDSSTIKVTYTAETDEDAQKTLEIIMGRYLQEHDVVYTGSTKHLEFYEQERERVGAGLQAAEEALKRRQEETNVISVDAEISNQLSMLGNSQNGLRQVEAQMEATRARIEVLRNQLSQLPEREVTSLTQVRNPAATKLQNDLVAAEVALQDLLQRYTEKDRRVQEKKQQIAMLKRELAAAEKEEVIGSQTTGLSALRRSREQELITAQANMKSMASERHVLRKQMGEIEASLAALRGQKVELDRLARSVELNQEAFMLYGRKLEEARIASGIDKQQLSNVAVIEQPHATYNTDTHKRIGIFLLAAFVGLFLGTAIAFGIEFFNDTLRTEEEVEHSLAVPVLATVPDLGARPIVLE